MVDIPSGGSFDIVQSNQTWNLLEGSVINNSIHYGINETMGCINNTINVYGSIYDPAKSGALGIFIEGKSTTLNIMSSAYINTEYGVLINGSGAHVTNYGTIDTVAMGIRTQAADAVIENHGKIFAASNGLETHGASTTNYATGLIAGGITGVLSTCSAGQTSTLYNYGSITGTSASFQGGEGNNVVINRGSLDGDVYLDSGNDTYNGLGGTLTNGSVYGGMGNDTYTIDQANIVLVENSGGGIDQVNATVSFTLGANFENLTLTRVGATGRGNGLENVIKGNIVANTLYGMDGNDTLYGMSGNDTLVGGAGSDMLYGGQGADVFVYATHNDIDTIKDFANGTDKIDIKGFGGISSFNDLMFNQAKASGANVVISSSTGKLIIENMTLAQMDAPDFIF